MSSIIDKISSKVFDFVHRNNLVYNACWEDPRIDKEALQLGSDDSILMIASAGCNALSYALSGVKRVCAVDVNYRQIALLELKIAGIKALDYETFFKLFGEGRLSGVLTVYREKLRPLLSSQSQFFWDRYVQQFFDNPDPAITFYYCGAAGYFARQLTRRIAKRGLATLVDALIDAKDMSAQREAWSKLRETFWTPALRFVVNRDATMALLGVPRAQRKQIEANGGKLASYVQKCLDSLFEEIPIQDNYFWRVYAKGRYVKNCCPEYLTELGFERLKSGAVDVVQTATASLEEFMRANPALKFSKFVLLDHMDWLSDARFDALESEWNAIFRSATSGARVIWRSGAEDASNFLDRVVVDFRGEKKPLAELLTRQTELAERLHRRCRVHTYASFGVADLRN